MVVAVVVSVGAGLALGHRWPAVLAITAGLLATNAVMSLSAARAVAGPSGVERAGWLAAHYLAAAIFLSLCWTFVNSVLDHEAPGLTDGLFFGLALGALNTLALWAESTGRSPRPRFPGFRLAGRREGRTHRRETGSRPPRL